MQLIDLSHTIEAGISLFADTAPQPIISAWMSHAGSVDRYEGTTCEITEVRMLTSIGTYMDSPYHFHREKDSIEALTLEQCVLPAILIDCTHIGERQPINPDVLDGIDVTGKAVLFHTGWGQHWKTDLYPRGPFLSGATAEALKTGGAKLAGMDFLVADDTSDLSRPVHVTLLGADILIIENMTNLERLPSDGFTLVAAPVKVKGAAAFPVRAFAMIE